jgi:uncharacterized membrane protein required for colicin V production
MLGNVCYTLANSTNNLGIIFIMLLEIIQKLNWIDLVIVIVMLRALYIGLKRGCVNEILQLLAIVAAILIVFHYYPFCSRFLENRIFFKAEIAKSLTFFVLWVVVALVSTFVRGGVYLLFKIEAKSFFDKIGGLAIAIVRGALIASLILSLFMTTGSEYLSRNIKSSFLSPRVAPLAPDVYKFVFKEFVSKYFPNEKMNQDFLGSDQEPVHRNQNEK